MLFGYNAEEIYLLFKKYSKKLRYIDLKNIIKLIYGIFFRKEIIIKGFNSGNIIEEIINDACKEKKIYNINQIKKPLLIPSVDLNQGNVMCFCSKKVRTTFSDQIKYENDINIGKAVRASCSYPAVFEPCEYKKYKLIDGGVRENIPWKETRKLGAKKVISVVFENDISGNTVNNIIDIIGTSLNILKHELSNYELQGADFLLKIKTKNVGLLDIEKIEELYEIGYKKAKEEMINIKNVLKKTCS